MPRFSPGVNDGGGLGFTPFKGLKFVGKDGKTAIPLTPLNRGTRKLASLLIARSERSVSAAIATPTSTPSSPPAGGGGGGASVFRNALPIGGLGTESLSIAATQERPRIVRRR